MKFTTLAGRPRKSTIDAVSVFYSGAMDAKTRMRQRIKRLLEDRGKTQRQLAEHLGHGDQWASNLLSGKHALAWDDLDRVADFLNVPPGEIVRVSDEPWELSPTEMRVVRALRMLPPPVRDHLTTLADYLIGVTPEEVGLLTKIRRLDVDDLAKFDHWIDVTLLRLHPERVPIPKADLGRTSRKRAAPAPRTATRPKH